MDRATKILATPYADYVTVMKQVISPAGLAILAQLEDLGYFDGKPRGPTTDVSEDMAQEMGVDFGILEANAQNVALSKRYRHFFGDECKVSLQGVLTRYRKYFEGTRFLDVAFAKMKRADRSNWSAKTSKEEQKKYFESRQSFNEASRLYFHDSAALLFKDFMRVADLANAASFCDVGAGPGAFASLVASASPAINATAIEMSYSFDEYRRASEAAYNKEKSVDMIAANFLHDDIGKRFDIVTANRLFSGVSKPDAPDWLTRLRKIVSPGGQLIFNDFIRIGDPNHDQWAAALRLLIMGWNQSVFEKEDWRKSPHLASWGFHREWTANDLRELLPAHGFAIESVQPGIPPFGIVTARAMD